MVGQNSVWHVLLRKELRAPELLPPETEPGRRRPPSPSACHVAACFAIQEKNTENLLLLILILALEKQISVLSRLD